MGRCALGTIYYAHICPQGRMLSSSIIKTLHVFLRKQVQTLPTNRGAKYVSLSARHCLLPWLCPGENIFYSVSWKKKKKKEKVYFLLPFCPIPSACDLLQIGKVLRCLFVMEQEGLRWPHMGFFAHLHCSPFV